MHGDVAPFADIEVLLNSYENFHTYIDDAHGISWIGQNGKGLCFHKIAKHEKMHAICSLNKGFGATNSVMVFPNQKTKELVSNCGGTLIFSTPTLHAGILAASKIADIHLSDEIYERQIQLNERITLFKNKAKSLNLPLINYAHTPIFFMGLGSLQYVFDFSKHLQNKGFITSVASAPSVPVKHSGLRISLNNNQTLKDIENLLNTIAEYMEDLENKGLFNREEALKGFKYRERERELVLA
jgi:7-keto-8-aminopelargonate synthetase-like enzyme